MKRKRKFDQVFTKLLLLARFPAEAEDLPWCQTNQRIAVTGWGQEEDKRKSQDAGFDRHMIKPVDPSALMELLARPGTR